MKVAHRFSAKCLGRDPRDTLTLHVPRWDPIQLTSLNKHLDLWFVRFFPKTLARHPKMLFGQFNKVSQTTFSTSLPAKALVVNPTSWHFGHLFPALGIQSWQMEQHPFLQTWTGLLTGGAPHRGHAIKSRIEWLFDIFPLISTTPVLYCVEFPRSPFPSTVTVYLGPIKSSF